MANPIEPMQWVSMVASFVIVLALLGATLWLLRRMGARSIKGSGGRLAIAESLWLGPRQRLALVRVDQHEVLVAITQQQVTLLLSLPDTAVANGEGGGASDAMLEPSAVAGVPSNEGRASPDLAVAQRFRQLIQGWTSGRSGGADK